jgi:hypothetical protein
MMFTHFLVKFSPDLPKILILRQRLARGMNVFYASLELSARLPLEGKVNPFKSCVGGNDTPNSVVSG